MAKGLEKNKPLPAVGVINGLKTTSELRPGVLEDELRIPIYQTDDFAEAEGKTVALYEYVADVLITGDDVEHLIPEDSLVDVTLKVDASEQMRLEVHFLSSDISVDKDLDTSKKQSIAEAKIAVDKGIKDAKRILKKLKAEGISIGDTMDKLSLVEEEAENSTESKMVLQHLKEVLRDIETLESGTEWERLDRNLREEFERLEHAQQTEGDNETEREVESLRSRVEAVIRSKDVRLGREILEEINHLYVRLTLLYQCIGLIQNMNDNFAYTQWKDRGRAKQLINQALELINTNPTVDRIHPITVLLIQLLPDEEAKLAGGLLK
jgi:protein DnaK